MATQAFPYEIIEEYIRGGCSVIYKIKPRNGLLDVSEDTTEYVLKTMSVSEEDITEFCRDNMAGFKIPKTIVFGPLPKTSTGKVQKFVLREQANNMSNE